MIAFIRLNRWRLALGGLACLAAAQAAAQFTATPAAYTPTALAPSRAGSDAEYRSDAARHLYASYPDAVLHGKLPPLMYAVAIVETEIAADGSVRNVKVVREPAAAKEVSPWLAQMIRQAAPFPTPANLSDGVKFTEVWLVHRDGHFQLHTLSEGQMASSR